MGMLIRTTATNGRLTRHSAQKLLLRTPIITTLTPDQKKVYQIGDPKKHAWDGYSTGGFTGGTTDASVVNSVGYQLINEALNGTPLWLDASGPHDPEMVWYQGAYSTCASYISSGRLQSEAYGQLAGFHFTVPSGLAGAITYAEVQFLNMGATFAYGPATDRSPANKNIKNGDAGWEGDNEWYVHFHLNTTETCNYHQTTIMNNWPYQSFGISYIGGAGDFRGIRKLWENGESASIDGYIPTLTNPVVDRFRLNDANFNMLKNNGHLWVVPMFHPIMEGMLYRPRSGWEGDGKNNYWACASLRDVRLSLVIDP